MSDVTTQSAAPIKVPERLKTCLEAGSVEALFPVLKDWPQGELRALLEDINAHWKVADAQIDDTWQKFAFRPEVFLSPQTSQQCDRVVKAIRNELFGVLSEVSSVALFYLRAQPAPQEEPDP